MPELPEFFARPDVRKLIDDSNTLWLSKDETYRNAKRDYNRSGALGDLLDFTYAAIEFSIATRAKDTAHDYLSRMGDNIVAQSGIIEEWNGPVGTASVYADCPELSVEWFNNRKKGIGGSEAGHLLGLNWMTRLGAPEPRFDSPDEIEASYRSSVKNKATPAVHGSGEADNLPYGLLMRGHHWERVSIANWALKHGARVAQSKSTYQGPEEYQHVNLDGLVLSSDGVPAGLIECKTTSRRKYWKDGVPVSYRCQVLYYLHALQLPWCIVIVRYDDGGFDEFLMNATDTVTGHPDAPGIDWIIENLSKVWDRMKKDIAKYDPADHVSDEHDYLRGSDSRIGRVDARIAKLMFHIDMPSPASRMLTGLTVDGTALELSPPAGFEAGWATGHIPAGAPSALAAKNAAGVVEALSAYDMLVSDDPKDLSHALVLPFTLVGRTPPTVVSPEEAERL